MNHLIRRNMLLSLLLGIGISLNIIESMIPLPIAIPGVKIGLANVVTLLVLYLFGKKEALILVILRVFLVGMLRTGLFSISFQLSFAGAMGSFLIMSLLYRRDLFTIIGVSVAGASISGISQLVLASYLLESSAIFYYLPYLLFLNVPMGIITGYITSRALVYLDHKGGMFHA